MRCSFLDAQDHVWTAGRQALQALGVIPLSVPELQPELQLALAA